MGIVVPPVAQAIGQQKTSFVDGRGNSSRNCMSQGFHQGIFSFSDGFDRPTEQEQQHVAQQSRRDKLRVQGFEPVPGHPLSGNEADGEVDGGGGTYEAASGDNMMLSEMFNFPPSAHPAGPSATELLATQIQAGYRLASRPQGPMVGGFPGDWYGSREGISIGDTKQINAESAAAMQLFLMNPQQQQQQQPPPRSPSPPALFQGGGGPFGGHDASFGGGLVDSQGLSLSLSSSLHQFEMGSRADQDLRLRDGVLYFNNQNQQQQNPVTPLQLLQGQQSQGHGHMGYGPAAVGVNLLRSSRYARAAQELLEEFCSVGRGQFKGKMGGRQHHDGSSFSNPNLTNAAGASSSIAAASSSSKDLPAPLSPADRFEHQRKKSKLISMLDEVDRRYNHYCDQMQMVVTTFDSVMGHGAATPYTALAQKAMSRHFRCLKDAVAAQLRRVCEALGEKEAGSGSGITKGETPRLRVLDQSLRQQRAFHQMGMMEQEAWRPQRGLPERSVNVLRAWLFEHFLHPYPSDADKHLLARQTGLSRNQVSNWFINARVRLWKPMVEEMYQHEAKDETDDTLTGDDGNNQRSHFPTRQPQQMMQTQQQQQQPHSQQQEQGPETDGAAHSGPTAALLTRHHRFPADNPQQALAGSSIGAGGDAEAAGNMLTPVIDELCGGTHQDLYHAARMRLGASGDVSLTLGLRHAGNASEKSQFPVKDFGDC